MPYYYQYAHNAAPRPEITKGQKSLVAKFTYSCPWYADVWILWLANLGYYLKFESELPTVQDTTS